MMFPVSLATGRSSGAGLLPQSLLLPPPSSHQRSFCFWEIVLDRTYLGYFARQCGVFFSLCQRVFFKDILPYSGKLWVRWAASVVRWLRPCLGLLPKKQACVSLRQSDLAASISKDTAKSQHFLLAYNVFFFSSVPKML